MRSRVLCWAICSGLMFTGKLMANDFLALQWMQSEGVIEGNTRRVDYEPETWGLSYQHLATNYSFGLDAWLGDSKESVPDSRLRLEEDVEGGSVYLGYTFEGWFISSNLSVNNADLSLHSDSISNYYSEKQESLDLNLSVDYLLRFGDIDLLPSFGLGWQHLETETTLNALTTPTVILSSEETQKNVYAFAGLGASYWWACSEGMIFSPGIQFGWTEYLDGDGEQVDRLSLITKKRGAHSRSNKQGFSVSNDGSGLVSGSLSFLFHDLSINYSLFRTVNSDENVTSQSVEVGFHF